MSNEDVEKIKQLLQPMLDAMEKRLNDRTDQHYQKLSNEFRDTRDFFCKGVSESHDRVDDFMKEIKRDIDALSKRVSDLEKAT